MLTLGGPLVLGYSSYRSSIPNGFLVTGCDGAAWNGVGHNRRTGGGTLNPFGLAFSAAGGVWTVALCNADSDGDGQTNGEELGDPTCVWTAGATPTRTTDITNPGEACASPSPPTTPPLPPLSPGDTMSPSAPQTVTAPPPDSSGPSKLTLFIAHGVLMALAWGALIPSGSALALLWRRALPAGGWFRLHWKLQAGGLVLAAAGLILALVATPHHRHFSSTHAALGLAVSIGAAVQGGGAALRPHKPAAADEPPSAARWAWRASHQLLALVLLALTVVQHVTAYGQLTNYGAGAGAIGGIYAVYGVGLAVSAGLAAVGWMRRDAPASDGTEGVSFKVQAATSS
jgi:hypothetical protein